MLSRLSWLDDVVRTVEVNLLNFTRVVEHLSGGDPEPGDLLASDGETAEQLLEQLRVDTGYRESVATRASLAVESARAQIDIIRAQVETERSELASIEASLIAAIGTGIGLFEITRGIGVEVVMAVGVVLVGMALAFFVSRGILGEGKNNLSRLVRRLGIVALASGAGAAVVAAALKPYADDATRLAILCALFVLPVAIAGIFRGQSRDTA
jgi:hypothetical protein